MKISQETGSLLPITVTEGEPTVSSIIISKQLGNEHESFMRLINTHKTAIEKDFGVLRFEIGKPKPNGGRPTKEVWLTEGQSLFLLALSKNSPQAVALKSKVVKSFLYFREHFYNNNSEQLNQLVVNITQIADSIVQVAKSQEVLVNIINNHNERIERLERFTVQEPKPVTINRPAIKGVYIDARDEEYDFVKINHNSVRRIIVNETVYYSIADFCNAIDSTTGAHQIAKKLNRQKPTAFKIWIFGNTHPAWFTTKNGLKLLVSGSRNLKNDRSVKLELRRV